MFEQTFVDEIGKTNKSWTVVVSFIAQCLMIGIFILVPLIYTDTLPRTQLTSFLVAPPPPGMFYSQIDPSAIQAAIWQVDTVSGRFYIRADISRALASGSGVYTFVLVANLEGQPRALTNFSLFVK